MCARTVAVGAHLIAASIAAAGIRVDLSPDHAGPYAFNQTVRVNVSLSRTDPGADIFVRYLRFDFGATGGYLELVPPFTDPVVIPHIRFWDFGSTPACSADGSRCGTAHAIDDRLSDASTQVFSITYLGSDVSPDEQIRIPGDGTSVRVGVVDVKPPYLEGFYRLDLLNATSSNTARGGEIQFGFGFTPEDPTTTWRAERGEIVGGRLTLEATPDCNGNGIPDYVDAYDRTSADCDVDDVPEECEPDTDGDGVVDGCDGCRYDPAVVDAPFCGCGFPDAADENGDGYPECVPFVAVLPVSASGPHAIDGSRIVLPQGGQTVTFDVFVGQWSIVHQSLRGIQIRFDDRTFVDGFGHRAELVEERRRCETDLDCADLSVSCINMNHRCLTHLGETPAANIDESRADFAFLGGAIVTGVDRSAAGSVRFGILLLDRDDAVFYTPPVKYIATFQIDIPAEAVGEIPIAVAQPGLDTGLVDGTPAGNWILPLRAVPARVVVRPATCGNGDCELGEDEASCQADCLVALCGNGDCEPGEDEVNCPDDCGVTPPPTPVPTMSTWGLVVMTLLCALVAKVSFRRRGTLAQA